MWPAYRDPSKVRLDVKILIGDIRRQGSSLSNVGIAHSSDGGDSANDKVKVCHKKDTCRFPVQW